MFAPGLNLGALRRARDPLWKFRSLQAKLDWHGSGDWQGRALAKAVLSRLRVQGFRNLREVELEAAAQGNWVVGANAAGKTALLESIYCLSRGRSFRGRRFGSLVGRGAASARVAGWIQSDVGAGRVSWISADGEVKREPAEGAESQLLVRLICEWTHALVDGEPALRRRFVDWNLMHWDRSAGAAFSRFRRVSAQRNAWLRDGAKGRAVWDEPYAETLAELLGRRARFFSRLADGFRQLSSDEAWFTDIDLQWDGLIADVDEVARRLQEMGLADRERGFTYLGISRADFSFRCEGVKWVGSRGQAKVLGCLLQVAAEQLVSGGDDLSSVWLVDDLDAELAPEWTERVVGLLRKKQYQTFYTALPGKVAFEGCQHADDRVFHVEHGRLSRASS